MRRLIIPLLVVILVIIVLFLGLPGLEMRFEQLIIESANSTKSYFAAISFVLLALDVFLPVPSSIVMFFNGSVLGLFAGTAWSLFAGVVSASLGFYLGRAFYQRMNRGYRSEEISKAQHIIERYGFAGIIATRGIPILSEAIAIICGNIAYDFKRFFIANCIGLLPISLLYAYIGSQSLDTDSFLWAFGINVLVAAVFLLMNLLQPRTR